MSEFLDFFGGVTSFQLYQNGNSNDNIRHRGNLRDFKVCQSNGEGLVIATGGDGEEGKNVNLKICLATH